MSDISPNLKGSELPVNYPIQGKTSKMIVSTFSRFRFVISMYCESTIFFPSKCVTSEAKEPFVSRTNALLVGTFISIDVESIPAATQTYWKRESFYKRNRF